jgi:REP element-mobilizing transposase RayT
MEDQARKRKSLRLMNYDYSSVGVYFLTICTESRRQILSRIVGGDVLGAPKSVELLPYGEIAEQYIWQMNDFYEHIQIDGYVIMPNHIHILLRVMERGAPGTSPPTRQHSSVALFVSTFKRFCNKAYGQNIWQRYFYDHVIRNRSDYEEHLRYIYDNPARWYFDELYDKDAPQNENPDRD